MSRRMSLLSLPIPALADGEWLAPAPEAGTGFLLGLGLFALAARRRASPTQHWGTRAASGGRRRA